MSVMCVVQIPKMTDKMTHQHIILTSLLLWTTLTHAQSTTRLHDTCVYSFSVPKPHLSHSSLLGGACPGMTELEIELEKLKRRDRLQEEQIAAMMTQQSKAASECAKLNGELFRLLQQSSNSNISGLRSPELYYRANRPTQ